MHIDGAQFDLAVLPPDRIEQPLAGEDPARMLEEMAEQAEFGGAERDRRAAALHLVAGHVHLDVRISELLADQSRADAAQHRHGAGDQFAWAEGLGHIIVGAGLEAADPIALLAARSQHDDRHVGGLGDAAKLAADLDAGEALQHPVEDDEVRRALARHDQSLFAVRRVLDLEILALKIEDQ